MGVASTVAFATAAVLAALVLGAASAACPRYRPALVTLLGGTVLAAAYVTGFTIAVERGAHRARLIDRVPIGVRECPAYMTVGGRLAHRRGGNGACVLRNTVDATILARIGGRRRPTPFTLDVTGMRDAPNARAVVADLVTESAGGVQTSDAGQALSRGVRSACCAANGSVHTDLSAMCPRADLLACDDLT